MSTLFITCGLQGAGKTTLAKKLERDRPALRLTADEWLFELLPGATRNEHDAARLAVERVQWATGRRALELGLDVVLDWGLWAREERDQFREDARSLGARVVLCYLDVPIDELQQRLTARNAQLPHGTFFISEREFEESADIFQRPTAEELALFDPM